MPTDVDWSAYSHVYDFMAKYNPAYQEIVSMCLQEAAGWSLPSGARLVDVGGGTGNFSVQLARLLPTAHVLHLERNPGMNEVARRKADTLGITNFEIVSGDAESAEYPDESLAAIVSVNALYAFREPTKIIQRMARWLCRGGRVFACDVGSEAPASRWVGYIVQEAVRREGVLGTLRLLRQGWTVYQQTKSAVQAKNERQFWSHDLETFKSTFEEAGIEVDRALKCYRNYSDLVIGRKL